MTHAIDLSGKTVVIIGSGLLGAEMCRACAHSGANVVITDVDAGKGEALATSIQKECPDRKVVFMRADATVLSEMQALCARVRSEFGKVDGIVNTAYPRTAGYGKSFEDGDIDEMVENAGLHFKTCMTSVRAFLPLLKEQHSGSIVFFGSIYGIKAPRFDIYEGTSMTVPAEYAAAKGGIISLTRYFAALLGGSGIRVNAISPGGIADGQHERFVEAYSEHLALGDGLLSPKDISGALVYLLSDSSGKMTGQNLVIDGGWTL